MHRTGLMLLTCLALLAAPLAAWAEPAYEKNRVVYPAGEKLAIRVNCGGEFADPHWCYLDQDKNVWLGDQEYLDGRQWGVVGGDGLFRDSDWITVVKNTRAAGMCLAERFGMKKYVFKLPAGAYTVRLHFMEGYFALYQPGARVFTVTINGKPVLEHFDIVKEAGDFGVAVMKEFKAINPNDGTLEIGFLTEVQSPVINGIEILGESNLADKFALTLGDPDGKGIEQLKDLGTPVYRVNCGMMLNPGYQYRGDGEVVWLQDQMWAADTTYGATGGDIDLRPVKERRTPVSRAVFGCERYNPLSYKFKVADGTYRLRLHFVETYAPNNAAGKRAFSVAIGDTVLADKIDPFALGGGLYKPGHVDLPEVTITGGLLELRFLPGTKEQQPMINGIEVFKTK